LLADVVVPISYSPRTGQHHHNLWSYKADPPSVHARWNLLALLLLFLRDHLACVAKHLGGAPSHLVTVPSTRRRSGPHPLSELIGDRLGLPRLAIETIGDYEPGDHRFHPDWFRADHPRSTTGTRILIVDDTWTTGARAQSLAYSLKTAGVAHVGIVILGRHVRPEHEPSRVLLKAIEEPLFDLTTCAAEDLG
jgi:hypothetical protein